MWTCARSASWSDPITFSFLVFLLIYKLISTKKEELLALLDRQQASGLATRVKFFSFLDCLSKLSMITSFKIFEGFLSLFFHSETCQSFFKWVFCAKFKTNAWAESIYSIRITAEFIIFIEEWITDTFSPEEPPSRISFQIMEIKNYQRETIMQKNW